MHNLDTAVRRLKNLITLFTCIIMVLSFVSCVNVYPSNTPQPFPSPTSTVTTIVFNPALSTSTTTPTEDIPLPRIEAFIADPSYNPGGSRLNKLGDAKIAVDSAWQHFSTQSYYASSSSLMDKYKPWDISALQKALNELKQTPWTSLYKASYFDCTEMSALLQRELSIRGFESWIVIGKDPTQPIGHAWVVVFLKSPSIQLVPVEATALFIPQPGSKTSFTNGVVQSYDDYSRQGWVLQDIYEAIAWWLYEFDWWAQTDVLQKLGLPTLVSPSTITPPFTPLPTPSMTLAPAVGLPGTALVISGNGFPANTLLKISWDGSLLSFTGSTSTTAVGTFNSVVIIPQTATAGQHIISVNAGTTSAVATFIVTVPPTTTTSPIPTTTYTTTIPTSTTTSVTTTTPTPIPQHIETSMQGVAMFSYSYMNYTRYCNTGEVISGIVQLTGPSGSVDNSYKWQFQVLGPGGESIRVIDADFRTTSSISFQVTAPYAGTYRIRITHQSTYTKTLKIDLAPAGWGYKDLK